MIVAPPGYARDCARLTGQASHLGNCGRFFKQDGGSTTTIGAGPVGLIGSEG
jgi:hypothetical protein